MDIQDIRTLGLHRDSFHRGFFLLLFFLLCFSSSTEAQNTEGQERDTVPVVDGIDVLRNIFNIKPKTDTTAASKKSSVAILPSVGYNPSFGFVIGANVAMVKLFGPPVTTGYSVYGLGLMYTSKGIFTAQVRHNVFREENKWNFQGHWQLSLYGLVDYSLGTGKSEYCYSGLNINDYPVTATDSSFPITYDYLRFYEKVYRKIGKHSYGGVGISVDIFQSIKDEKLTDEFSTPHYRYSLKHGYDPENYSANGLLLAFQYNTREHPIRSYGGIYFDIWFRFDLKAMASTSNALVMQYDFRKYWSLSKRNPEHVFAIWHWAAYKLSGSLPYLQLPYTGSDTYNRSGRGYTIGRFRGPSYAIFETEYRFPITPNKLFSGVVFLNAQSAANDEGQKIYSEWNGGGGVGLRILFQKNNRSCVCVDFSKGNCGSEGIFFGLNEVF